MIKAYLWDWNNELWDYFITQKSAIKYAKKLCRHFKIPMGKIRFYGRSRGTAYYSTNNIKLPKHSLRLGLLCHEVGHLLAFKYGQTGHTKKAYKYIKRVYCYAEKRFVSKVDNWQIGNDVY